MLKDVCHSSQPEVDGDAVTLTYLIRKEFKELSSLKQGLCIRMLTRRVKAPPCFRQRRTAGLYASRLPNLVPKRSVQDNGARKEFLWY